MAYIPTSTFVTTPTNNGTVILKAGFNILNPSGALLLLNLSLPSNPSDGEEVVICTTQSITSITILGGTVLNGITTFILGGFAGFSYSTITSKWHRSR